MGECVCKCRDYLAAAAYRRNIDRGLVPGPSSVVSTFTVAPAGEFLQLHDISLNRCLEYRPVQHIRQSPEISAVTRYFFEPLPRIPLGVTRYFSKPLHEAPSRNSSVFVTAKWSCDTLHLESPVVCTVQPLVQVPVGVFLLTLSMPRR
jgi:hypothetical protein